MSKPRFAGLQATLLAMSRPVSGARIAAIKRGDASPAPTPTVAPRTAAAEPKRAAPAKREAAPWQVPSEVAAQGETKAQVYRTSFELVSDQLRRTSAMPAARCRIAAAIEMVAAGASDAEIRSSIGNHPTDQQRAATRTWERAIKSTCGSIVAGPPAVSQPQPRGAARQRMLAVATDPAFNGNEGQALALLTAPAAYGMSADDIIAIIGGDRGLDRGAKVWDAAIAAVCT